MYCKTDGFKDLPESVDENSDSNHCEIPTKIEQQVQ